MGRSRYRSRKEKWEITPRRMRRARRAIVVFLGILAANVVVLSLAETFEREMEYRDAQEVTP